jgi:hypothetical protein
MKIKERHMTWGLMTSFFYGMKARVQIEAKRRGFRIWGDKRFRNSG